MIGQLRKTVLLCVVLLSIFSSFSALAASSNANWSETFALKGGSWVMHTPTYVSFDGIIRAGVGIDIDAGSSFNGVIFGGCGLHIKTDSTRQEFVKALTCSGLYPA